MDPTQEVLTEREEIVARRWQHLVHVLTGNGDRRRAAAQKESAVRLACAALPALNEDGTSVPSAVSQDHRELFARAQRYALARWSPRARLSAERDMVCVCAGGCPCPMMKL